MAEGGIIPILDAEKPTSPPISPIDAIAALKVRAASGTLPNPSPRMRPATAPLRTHAAGPVHHPTPPTRPHGSDAQKPPQWLRTALGTTP